jgi:hypothetical protein
LKRVGGCIANFPEKSGYIHVNIHRRHLDRCAVLVSARRIEI